MHFICSPEEELEQIITLARRQNPCLQKKTQILIWILGNTKNLGTEVTLDCSPTAITQGWGSRFSTLLWHRPQSIPSQLHHTHTHTDSLLPSRSQSCPSPPSPFKPVDQIFTPHLTEQVQLHHTWTYEVGHSSITSEWVLYTNKIKF